MWLNDARLQVRGQHPLLPHTGDIQENSEEEEGSLEGEVSVEEGHDSVASSPRAVRSPGYLRILVYLVMYDSGQVSLEHLLLSRHPYQSHPGKTIFFQKSGSEKY